MAYLYANDLIIESSNAFRSFAETALTVMSYSYDRDEIDVCSQVGGVI